MPSRLAGAVAAIGAVLLAVSGFTSYLIVSGRDVVPPTEPLAVVVGLLWPLAVLALAACLVTGRWARAGYAGVIAAGLISLGELVLDLYTLSDERAHPGYEVFFGQRLLTTSIEPATGAWLLLAGHAALGLALLVLLLPGARPQATDDTSFDGSRPLLGGLALFGGGLALVALVAAPVSVPDRAVVDPDTGLTVPAPVPGTIAVLDRTGLALAGGILLAVAAATAVCLAPLIRPRLATVAMFAALAVYLGTRGVLAGLDASRSADVVLGFGAVALLIAAAYLAALAVVAGRSRRPVAPSAPAQLEMLGAVPSPEEESELGSTPGR